MTHVLAIDQGTTSTRAVLFDGQMRLKAVAQEKFPQLPPLRLRGARPGAGVAPDSRGAAGDEGGLFSLSVRPLRVTSGRWVSAAARARGRPDIGPCRHSALAAQLHLSAQAGQGIGKLRLQPA